MILKRQKDKKEQKDNTHFFYEFDWRIGKYNKLT